MLRLRMKGACTLVAAGLVAACTEQATQLGIQADITPPTVAIVVPANDTINVENGFGFTVDATDNLGLKTITVTLTAGLSGHDTTFTSAVTDVGWIVTVPQSETATLGGPVLITATAVDGNNNATTDTVTVIATNPKALIVTLVRPSPGAITAPGKQLPVEVHASQVDGLQLVGWRTIPGQAAVSAADTLYTPGLPADTVFQDTLTVPAATAAGTFSIVAFALDASGRTVTTSPPLVVTVQLVVTDTAGPLVTFTVAQRAEVKDSISVRARDPSGISSIGWVALDLSGTQLAGVTTALGGTLTDVTETYDLNLPLGGAQLPAKVVLKAFATDAAGNTDSAHVDTLVITSAVRSDTITVVNGITEPLPAGGRVADAIYNPNRNELYLTNIDLDRVEVFSVADTSFHAAIPVGSRPWGIALWPRDTLGHNADTVVVGNSGSTDMSVVNVALGQEVRRHPLPSYGVQTVKTVVNAGGGKDFVVTEYHFDDRPQYVATVCRKGNCTDSVVVVYSTTPTPAQTSPFARRGSVRWDKLSGAVNPLTGCPTNPEEHFFWEQAVSGKATTSDTLAVVARRCGVSTQLLSSYAGVIATVAELGFLDSTYVRNSGNFVHTLLGEGGSGAPVLAYARALAYDAKQDVIPTILADTAGVFFSVPLNLDQGISPALDVRNQITNTATAIQAIGVNFNGSTNLIRADSVFVLDQNLRLRGLVSIGGPNFGMDLNSIHDYDATTGVSAGAFAHTPTANADRMTFVASPDPEIDVYDTYYPGTRLASIPIKDPVIGPLRVAKLASGEQILIGVTVHGVVVVRLPAVTNPNTKSAGWGGGEE
jgi:hypothetical protein